MGPLITPLTAHADIHLRIRPGTSGALALSMANVIIEEGLYDREFVQNYSLGFEEYRAYVAQFPPNVAEEITGVPAAKIIEAARLYATTKPACMMNSASPTTHHTNGLQNHRAIVRLSGSPVTMTLQGEIRWCLPAYLYQQSPGIVTREPEFEQPRPWEEMAPRIGQDVHPAWCRLRPGGPVHATPLPDPERQALPDPCHAWFRPQPPDVAGTGFYGGRASRSSTSSWMSTSS